MDKVYKKYGVYLIMFIAVSAINSCSSSSTYQSNSRWTLSSIYNPLKNKLHPIYKVHHNSKSTSVLFFKIRASELHFLENSGSKKESCSFTLTYLLQEVQEEGNPIVDSNKYVYEFGKEDIKNYYITQVPIKAIEGRSYRLKVVLRDNNRKAFNIRYLNIEKQRNFGEQYFNVTTINGTPIFKNVIVNDGVFKIDHTMPTSDTLYVSYFKNLSEAPKPLFAASSDQYLYRKYDSLYIINYNTNSVFSLPHEGLYYLQFDTSSSEGISLLRLNSNFPRVKEPEGLIPPLSYITTDAEFKKLGNADNPKLTADNFWIKVGGSPEKGREMIRLYYNRVYFANYYFTNTKPGWKTDRGMVYVVYGPPHKMKKSNNSETWIYEWKGDSNPITFNFTYSPTAYHLNNYNLNRTANSEWHWTEAVYNWINGDIFLYD